MSASIDVVLLTHDRPASARAALASILAQWYEGPVTALVCSDGPTIESELLELASGSGTRVEVYRSPVPAGGDISTRLARMRNWTVAQGTGDLVAFLDDDNVFLPDHLVSLVTALERKSCRAAHSWRRLASPEGAPWFGDRFPWAQDLPGEPTFEDWCRKGVLHPGSDLLRDRPVLRDGSLGMVDTSCWMLGRELCRRVPFPEQRTAEDVAAIRTEDDLLLEQLVAAGTEVACTWTPTVSYRLGGYSTAHALAAAMAD
jgi:hypothetical protein